MSTFFIRCLRLGVGASLLIWIGGSAMAAAHSRDLRGQVLLQVQRHGEAWYVWPSDGRRYYLRDGTAAYQIMRQLGLGISNVDLQRLLRGDLSLRARLRGRILLKTQAHGEAYFLCPRNNRLSYIRDGATAYQLLRDCGLGVRDADLNDVSVGSLPGEPIAVSPPTVQPPMIQANTPKIGKCQIYPADNPWNRDISHDPLNGRSTAYVAAIGTNEFLHPDFGSNQDYGLPFVVVSGDQPRVPIAFTAYGDESDPGPYPIPPSAPIEAGEDHHLLAVDQDHCKLYELYHAVKRGDGWAADAGAVFDLTSNALRPDGWTSADAAGLPIFPGLLRYDEVASGHVNHAIRFTANNVQNGFIHPATHRVGDDNPNFPPMGARFRLKADFDTSSYHGQARTILQTMKIYGLILADVGSNWYFQGATDPRWNDDDLNQLKQVPGSAFEAIDSGPILKP